MFNFQLVDDPNHHICEAQLVHERLMTDRKEGGAHHSYNIFRAAFELLEATGNLPDNKAFVHDKRRPTLTQAGSSGKTDRVLALAALLKDGLITLEEFAEMKASL